LSKLSVGGVNRAQKRQSGNVLGNKEMTRYPSG